MKQLLVSGLLIVGSLFSQNTFAASSSIRIQNLGPNMTITGSISAQVQFDPQSGTGFIECSLRKPVPARKILYFTGSVILPTNSGATFEIDMSDGKFTKGTYIISCMHYDLANTLQQRNALVKFRFLPPPPIVRGALEEGNLIRNPEFLQLRGELPAFWRYGSYGRNEITQDHLFTGLVSKRSLRTTITKYISGDAKWYFHDVPAIGGRTYIYAQKYHTTTPAKVTVRYSMKDGKYQYDELQYLPVTPGNFSESRVYFIAPKDAVALTVWTSIASEGSLVIDDPLLLLSPGDNTP